MQRDLDNEYKIICALEKINDSLDYSCSGNILNLNNFLNESEVRDECDIEYNENSNCLIHIQIKVIQSERKILFKASHFDENDWKN